MARNILEPLNEDEFNEVVNNDVRDTATRAQSKALRTPEMSGRWLNALHSLKRSVESQFVSARAERAVKASEFARSKTGKISIVTGQGKGDSVTQQMTELEFAAWQEKWRSGAVRFLSGVEDCIVEAKDIRNDIRTEEKVTLLLIERDVLFKDLLKLRTGIMTHRETVSEDEDASAEADENLWALVD